jgi:hypothetical protein
MPRSFRIAVVALALLVSAGALPAWGLIPCELCEEGMPPSTRCAGICNGQLVRFCSDWFAQGCQGWSLTAEPAAASAEERFLQALAAPVETPSAEVPR